MSSTIPRPPPLPVKRSRNLALWIIGITLLGMLLLGGGTFLGIRALISSIGLGEFSMEDYQCGKNIGEITLLKEEWVTAHDGKNGDVIPPADVEALYTEHDGQLICPLDPKKTPQTSYEIGSIGADPKCKCTALHEQRREEQKKKEK